MEKSHSLQDLIEMLEDLLSDATRVPFKKKSLVDVDKMSEIIGDMQMALPVEIQQAQKVVMDKNIIINEAKKEAESIIRKAEQRRAELLDENDLVREARRRATEMVSAEQNRCTDLRASTNDYVDKMLRRIEELLANDLNNLETLRTSINGMRNNVQNLAPTLQGVDKRGN